MYFSISAGLGASSRTITPFLSFATSLSFSVAFVIVTVPSASTSNSTTVVIFSKPAGATVSSSV